MECTHHENNTATLTCKECAEGQKHSETKRGDVSASQKLFGNIFGDRTLLSLQTKLLFILWDHNKIISTLCVDFNLYCSEINEEMLLRIRFYLFKMNEWNCSALCFAVITDFFLFIFFTFFIFLSVMLCFSFHNMVRNKKARWQRFIQRTWCDSSRLLSKCLFRFRSKKEESLVS